MQQDKYSLNRRAVQQRIREKGFTLIEALAALAVLSVAMTPLFVQINAAFRISRTIQENLTASMLAQEGVELVRGIRDGNWFRDDPFELGLDGCAAGCYMDYDDFSLTTGVSPLLKQDLQKRFQYDSGTDTAYARTITITEPSPASPPVHFLVTSEVTWDSRGTTRTIIVENHIFDWLRP